MVHRKERESKLEKNACGYLRSLGCICHKLRGRGWPDRMILSGKDIFFIEFKRKGEKPRRLQEIVHQEIRSRGHRVYVVDDEQTLDFVVFEEQLDEWC